MVPQVSSRERHRWHIAGGIGAALALLATAGLVLMFVLWPFRYGKVHPLLEKEFHSRVKVTRYYRTYFPHPGFVADGVTFWRKGQLGAPPMATIHHLQVVGTWSGLLFTPHTLYQIWLRGMHLRIVLKSPAPSKRKTQNHSASPAAVHPAAVKPVSSAKKPHSREQNKLHVETIVADGALLDFLRAGKPPLRFVFSTLQIHNLHAGEPLTFFARAKIPPLNAVVDANGKLGPLRPGRYAEMPLTGRYSLQRANLSRVSGLAGHVSANGSYSGIVRRVNVTGKAAIPDFRAGHAHVERLDASYRVTVEATEGRVLWRDARIRLGDSTIRANGSLTGEPKVARVEFATKDGNLKRLLEVVEARTPSVRGKVSFAARASFGFGPQPFLKRLRLRGHVALEDVTFVQPKAQQKLDAFSARARNSRNRKTINIDAAAAGETVFRHGIAYFHNVQVTLPGAQASLHGIFNLMNTRVNLTGKVAMQQALSQDVKGWKRWLLVPLDPFFHHGRAGAVIPIAVTGTAASPKVQQNLLHTK